MFKLVLEKAEEPEIRLPTSAGSTKKQESSRKTPTSALLTTSKPLTVWISTNSGKLFERWEYHFTCLLRNLYAGQEAPVRSGHGTIDQFQTGKGILQGWILPPTYLTCMQSTSCKMPGWMKHELESRLLGAISITSEMQMTLLNGRKWRGTKVPHDEGEKGEWKSWLKTQHSKN